MSFKVEIYRDAGRTELMAEGKKPSPTGIVDLSQNDSGLSGRFEIEFNSESETVQLFLIPASLSSRLQKLRERWRADDWPTNPYSKDSEGPLPIVDPNLIIQDDFRRPVAGNPAFELWQARLSQVDGIRADLEAKRETNGFEFVLKQVLGDPLPDLATLMQNLTQGNEVTATAGKLKSLNLTIESFTRLMEIKREAAGTGAHGSMATPGNDGSRPAVGRPI